MPILLGNRPPVPDDPFAMLTDCHERIRRFTALARRLAEAPAGTPSEELAGAASDVLRYFTVALPLHERDEEDSLAPRLAGRTLDEPVRSALGALAPEHRVLEATLATLVPHWEEIARDPSAPREAVTEPAERLASLFDAHLEREERVLFPAARAAMAPRDLAALLAEMRERRR